MYNDDTEYKMGYVDSDDHLNDDVLGIGIGIGKYGKMKPERTGTRSFPVPEKRRCWQCHAYPDCFV
jgi:hypothetical protein